jgi:transcriptional regulator with XRE-family HTH domain
MIPIMTDSDILKEIGRRLRSYRLQRNLTAEHIATQAGIQLRTLLNAERGANPRLATLIKILRALDRLDGLDAFLPDPGLSPMALLKLKGKQRRRATGSGHA